MTKSAQQLRGGTSNRCAVCDGKFGLIRHYSWRTALCSRKCKHHFKNCRDGDHKWLLRCYATWEHAQRACLNFV
jgi:hypothetical protein